MTVATNDIDLNAIPAELRAIPHWIGWNWGERDGKRTKLPKVPGQRKCAKVNDPSTWSDFPTAAGHIEAHDGLGFVISEGDGLVGIDFDDILEDGTVVDWAKKFVEMLSARTYGEVSPSGNGLKFICLAKKPFERCRLKSIGVELYSKNRFFTITGRAVDPDVCIVADAQDVVDDLFKFLWPHGDEAHSGREKSQSEASPSVSDDEIITMAGAARNGEKFARLYRDADLDEYSEDHSAGDLALCNLLAFFTQDRAQLDRLFRASGLMRPKWDERRGTTTYGEMTIDMAISGLKETWKGRPSGSFGLNDLGNAHRLVMLYGDQILFWATGTKIGDGKWLVWDGTRWAEDTLASVHEFANQLPKSIHAEAARIDDATKRREYGKWASQSANHHRLVTCVARASTFPDVRVRTEDLDTDPWLFNVANGTLELRTGKLRKHDRNDRITKVSPVAFDASATCPKWLAFLHTIFGGDEELIRFLQRAVGYSLTGDVTEQCLFILHGNGANGKSTFLGTVRALMADYGQKVSSDALVVKRQADPHGQSGEIAKLCGSRFVMSCETEDGRRLAESLVKDLCGGETITARQMYQRSIEFAPTFKIWMGTNHMPTVRGTDYAIWRRIHLLPFAVTIPKDKRDKTLAATLRNELPGILNWALAGCKAWLDTGLRPPRIVTAATAKYRSEMDVLGQFIADRCVEGPKESATSADLFAAYQKWCVENGQDNVSSNMFGRQMHERGHDPGKVPSGPKRGNSSWKGIGMREADPTRKGQERR